jgi:hypothetical protein
VTAEVVGGLGNEGRLALRMLARPQSCRLSRAGEITFDRITLDALLRSGHAW